jgi:hypothetical protein
MEDTKGKEIKMMDDEEVVFQIRDLDAEAEAAAANNDSDSSDSSDAAAAAEPLTPSSVTLMSMEPISAANVGSLLRFFQSMFFDSWITISYLYKFREHAGVCDYLCNELYKFQEREVEKYIPQLWYVPPPSPPARICPLAPRHSRAHAPAIRADAKSPVAKAWHFASSASTNLL